MTLINNWSNLIKPRRNKYGAVKVFDKESGITFDSKGEYARYLDLKLLEKAGKIRDLVVHKIYPLHANGKTIWKMEADFDYFDVEANCLVTEDFKGVYTQTSKAKHKHFHAEYGRPVKITKARGR